MEKQFIQIQIALFFKSDFTGPFESVSLKIKEIFGNDLNSQIIGIPNNAPAEIPRVTVNSPLVNINFAKNRVDFFSKNQNFFAENADQIFDLLHNLSVHIGRIGVVTTHFKSMEINNLKEIFNQEKISSIKPTEISIRFNQQELLDSFTVNNSQACAVGTSKTPPGEITNGIILTRDINTRLEDLGINNFTKETAIPFIKNIIFKTEESVF